MGAWVGKMWEMGRKCREQGIAGANGKDIRGGGEG